MWNRILLLVRTHLAGEWMGERGARLPVAPVLFQASLGLLLCGLARDALPPFGYAVFALSIPAALGALALLGELAPLLRADPAAEWIGSQPVRPIELRAARVLVVVLLLGGLALGSLLPAAALAPAGTGWVGRMAIVLGGLALCGFVAAVLLVLQGLLGGWAEGALVVLHTALFCLVIVGFLAGLGRLDALATFERAEGPLAAYPPAWFASWLPGVAGTGGVLAAAATLLAALAFAFAPFPRAPRARRKRAPLTVLLAPLRALATRIWVRPAERGPFDLVYDGLPAERDFVTRTYPLMAVPFAFLLLGAESGTDAGEGLFALLLFAPVAYLPVLLIHVPATATPAARWILDSAPLDPADEAAGARKAVALRLFAPLFLTLGVVVWWLGDLHLALRLTPVAAATGLLALRISWSTFVRQPPLSTAPGELGSAWDDASASGMLAAAIGSTLLAIAVWRYVPNAGWAFGILGAVVAYEVMRCR